MEYIYSALLLHKAGQDVTEDNVKKVLTAAGVSPDDGRVKALIAALDGVDIEDAIANAAPVAAPAAAAPAAEAGEAAEETEEESEEDKEKEEEAAAAGLGSLFG